MEQVTRENQDYHLCVSPACSNPASKLQHRPLCWSSFLLTWGCELMLYNASLNPTRKKLDLSRHQEAGDLLPTNLCFCISSLLVPQAGQYCVSGSCILGYPMYQGSCVLGLKTPNNNFCINLYLLPPAVPQAATFYLPHWMDFLQIQTIRAPPLGPQCQPLPHSSVRGSHRSWSLALPVEQSLIRESLFQSWNTIIRDMMGIEPMSLHSIFFIASEVEK